jgi:hypothetical protein
MKQIVKSIWILILFIGFSNNLRASENYTVDSIKVTQIVNKFYDLYLTSIKEKKYSDFKPKFVQTINGMTSLDYTKYLDNLQIYRFSDSLIIKERQSYSVCLENLGKIKYSDFQITTFTDLDEYERANCDFGNYYRWIGGQEPIDGIRIIDIEFISTDKAYITIDYFVFNSGEDKKYYWGKNGLTLIKIDSDWFIDQIDSWKND